SPRPAVYKASHHGKVKGCLEDCVLPMRQVGTATVARLKALIARAYIGGVRRRHAMQPVHVDIPKPDLALLCQSCESRHQGICGALTPAQRAALVRHSRRVQRAPGELLLADAEPIF